MTNGNGATAAQLVALVERAQSEHVRLGGTLQEMLDVMAAETPLWVPPVGSDKYPPAMWYAANRHSLDGVGNEGRIHSGVDWNVQVWPRGDIDQGQPLWAVTRATVYAVAYSTNYLGSVVLKTTENGEDLYIRYWHLADNATFRALQVGQVVNAGDCLGHIGNYKMGAGGDHAHFDTARSPFGAHFWLTVHPYPEVLWCDPIPILKRHLGPALIDAMMSVL